MSNDDPNVPTTESTDKPAAPARRRAAGRPAGPPAAVSFSAPADTAPPAKKTKKAASKPAKSEDEPEEAASEPTADESPEPQAEKAPTEKAQAEKAQPEKVESKPERATKAPGATAMFQAPPPGLAPALPNETADGADDDQSDEDDETDDGAPKRRRRSRGGRRRRKSDGGGESGSGHDGADADDSEDDSDDEGGNGTRRRRRRARAGEGSNASPDDPENTTVRVRQGRSAADEVTAVTGSTRLEAKKQRRREGREAGRRRAPIVSEAEFLARRESVTRQMVVRQHTGPDASDNYVQIAVLEDKVLVEHYVARESQTSQIGNVYLGKVQNVLPSMEAAFVDIGQGRNAVLYAGEVDWSTLGNGKPRKIEEVLSPGQVILVQVTKDPIGQKGARLTSQVSLPGRFLVLVPGGQNNGISRKLPENERARLKTLLKEVLPEGTGVIVRTAAEGATEDQLTRDVAGLTARWTDIEAKVTAGKAPQLLYAEPDLTIKVVRDLFNEDFTSMVVEGDDAWDMIRGYVDHVAPDLADRVSRWEPEEGGGDSFAGFRIDEQITKALDRKVFLPSGGSLIIDRTEAMTVVDVNTGKYTGSGGNLEETVTKNNLEAAEEVVRQLRLRDIGGIIVVDFIDMVLESNRDLVLRRLVECLGRDRTRHQVAEVTSLGLVQMTRKRIGTGLLESFSVDCDHCKGRGVVISGAPVEAKRDEGPRRGGRGGRGRGNGGGGNNGGGSNGGGGNGGGGSANGGQRTPHDAPKSQEPKPQEPKPQEPKPQEPKPQEPKPQEPKPPEPKPQEPTPDQPKPLDQPVDAEPKADKPSGRRRAASKPAGPPPTTADPVLTSEGTPS